MRSYRINWNIEKLAEGKPDALYYIHKSKSSFL